MTELNMTIGLQTYTGQRLFVCLGCDLSGDIHFFVNEERGCELCNSKQMLTPQLIAGLGEKLQSLYAKLNHPPIVPALINDQQIEAFVTDTQNGEAPRFTLNEFAQICRRLADSFYHDPATGERKIMNPGERIMLMVSELSEAFEGVRKDKTDDHLPWRKNAEVEMGDALIREFDFSAENNYDLDGAFWEKLLYNTKRPDHKPENRILPGGKKW